MHEIFSGSVMTVTFNWFSKYTDILAFSFFFKDFIIYFQREEEGEREGEKHQCVVGSRMPPTWDLAGNPGTCPDWELNWQTFASQSGAQSTELQQPGCGIFLQTSNMPTH